MHKPGPSPAIARTLTALGALGLALFSAQTPAHAAADITNFNVQNCTDERVFVCSYDKTDGSLKIPYKARGLQPGERKEFGCASLGRCKVIIGISDKRLKTHVTESVTQSTAEDPVMNVGFGIMIAGAGTAISGALVSATLVTPLTIASGLGIGAVVFAAAVGGTVGALEIADGWSDGEVCNQVRRAAQKAGIKPKDYMQSGKKYKVIPQYAVSENGNPYIYADGAAVFTYKATQGDSCPPSLQEQFFAK